MSSIETTISDLERIKARAEELRKATEGTTLPDGRVGELIADELGYINETASDAMDSVQSMINKLKSGGA